MNKNDIFTMSSQEMDALDVINRIKRQELTQVKGAEILEISTRHLRRLITKFNEHGKYGLVSKRRGKPSNRAYAKDLQDSVVNIIKEKYPDFGPTLASEKLEERDNIKIHKSTVRRWMIAGGVFSGRHRRTTAVHQSRERRECFGELVQIDGSPHDWFEGRADKCCLIEFVDDATSQLVYARFEESETTQAYFRATKDYINIYGRPGSFYSDRDSIFRVNHKTTTKPAVTQFQRAMKELDIDLICALSAQAKGRVERKHKVGQDRLIKEMRLRGINNINDANKFLPEYIAKYDIKFAKEPKSNIDVHRKNNLSAERLDYILSVRKNAKVSKNLEFNFNNLIYQIKTNTKGYRLRQSSVTIAINTDDITTVWFKNQKIDYTIIDKNLKTIISDNKNINKIIKPRAQYIPPPDHPWRKYNLFYKKITVSLHDQNKK